MLRLTLIVMIVALLCLACGDDAEDVSLSDDATLETLDYEDQMALCDELIAAAPSSCWQVDENRYVYPKLRAEDGVPSIEMQACLANVLARDGGISVGELKTYYAGADEESCEIDDESCGPVTPVNGEECTDPSEECVEILMCSEWTEPLLCLELCCGDV